MSTVEEMFSGNEWIIVAIVALLLFGGANIPKLARGLGEAQSEFKKGLTESVVDDDDTKKSVDDGTPDNGDEPAAPQD